MDTSALSRSLQTLRWKIRALFAAEGLAKCALVIAGYAIITFVLDSPYLIGLRFPFPVRIVLLAIGLGVLAYVFFRYFWYPVTTKLTDDDLALCVEQGYPALGDRLISSLQLARTVGQDPFTSDEMVGALVAETHSVIQNVDFGRVVKAARLILYLMIVAVLAATITTLCVFDRGRLAGTWLNRFVLVFSANPEWERLTQQQVIDINRVGQTFDAELKRSKGKQDADVAKMRKQKLGEVIVPEGAHVPVVFEIRGKQPDPDEIFVRMSGDREDEKPIGVLLLTDPKDPEGSARGPQRYRAMIPALQSDFTFEIRAGDSARTSHTVKVVRRPSLRMAPKVTLTRPSYIPPKTANRFGGVSSGTVTGLPIFTEVEISIEPSVPNVDTGSVRMFVWKEVNGEIDSEELLMKPSPNGPQFTTTLLITGSCSYSFAMSKTHKKGSSFHKIDSDEGAARFRIICRNDLAPVIKIVQPNPKTPVSSLDRVKMIGTVRDDVELGRFELQYRVAVNSEPSTPPADPRLLAITQYYENQNRKLSDEVLEYFKLTGTQGHTVLSQWNTLEWITHKREDGVPKTVSELPFTLPLKNLTVLEIDQEEADAPAVPAPKADKTKWVRRSLRKNDYVELRILAADQRDLLVETDKRGWDDRSELEREFNTAAIAAAEAGNKLKKHTLLLDRIDLPLPQRMTASSLKTLLGSLTQALEEDPKEIRRLKQEGEANKATLVTVTKELEGWKKRLDAGQKLSERETVLMKEALALATELPNSIVVNREQGRSLDEKVKREKRVFPSVQAATLAFEVAGIKAYLFSQMIPHVSESNTITLEVMSDLEILALVYERMAALSSRIRDLESTQQLGKAILADIKIPNFEPTQEETEQARKDSTDKKKIDPVELAKDRSEGRLRAALRDASRAVETQKSVTTHLNQLRIEFLALAEMMDRTGLFPAKPPAEEKPPADEPDEGNTDGAKKTLKEHLSSLQGFQETVRTVIAPKLAALTDAHSDKAQRQLVKLPPLLNPKQSAAEAMRNSPKLSDVKLQADEHEAEVIRGLGEIALMVPDLQGLPDVLRNLERQLARLKAITDWLNGELDKAGQTPAPDSTQKPSDD